MQINPGGPPPHASSGSALMEAFMAEQSAEQRADQYRLLANQVTNGLVRIARGAPDAPLIADHCLRNLSTALELLNGLLVEMQRELAAALQAAGE